MGLRTVDTCIRTYVRTYLKHCRVGNPLYDYILFTILYEAACVQKTPLDCQCAHVRVVNPRRTRALRVGNHLR